MSNDKICMILLMHYKERFKNAVHYVSSSIMAKNRAFMKESPYKLTTLLAIPAGIGLYFYLTKTKSKAILKKKE